MKKSIKDINILKNLAIVLNRPESNKAIINNRELILTYTPNKLYPFSIKIMEGEYYDTALFSDSEVNKIRDIWNKFILGNYSKEALLHEISAEQQYKNSLKQQL